MVGLRPCVSTMDQGRRTNDLFGAFMIRTRAFASLLAATMFVGCAPKKQTTLTPPPPEPNPEPRLATDAHQRVQQLGGLADQYTAGKLPGANEQQDRQLVAEQFNQLSQILPLL